MFGHVILFFTWNLGEIEIRAAPIQLAVQAQSANVGNIAFRDTIARVHCLFYLSSPHVLGNNTVFTKKPVCFEQQYFKVLFQKL